MGCRIVPTPSASSSPPSSAENWQRAGFGLYVHWPYCASKCPYCDFNSHVPSGIDHSRWKRAYVAEIGRLSAAYPDRVLSTIFLGGGTPSLMPPDLVGTIIETARAAWRPANDMEITLEANPGSVEAGRFAGYRDAGVNRVSVGVQALNDDDLRRLGRLHSAEEARRAVATARDVFDRVSLDLIYARQGQGLDDWTAELSEALALAGDHMSLYQLTIEDGTVFAERHRRGQLRGLLDEDLAADLYLATAEIMAEAGYGAYEVSNHARPGAESRHNLIYWRSGDWAGVGPGAHGRLTTGGRRIATESALWPVSWFERVERTGSGETVVREIASDEAAEEAVMMGLRLEEGIEVSEAFGVIPEKTIMINDLIQGGLLKMENDRLSATPAGRLVLNAVLRRLLD
jgi:oxygen-independent coproporphyrinogen-3 oxidase